MQVYLRCIELHDVGAGGDGSAVEEGKDHADIFFAADIDDSPGGAFQASVRHHFCFGIFVQGTSREAADAHDIEGAG